MTSKFNLALDSSQISEYMTCPLKWFYRYNQNLVFDTKQKVAPDKGTLVHNLLDIYYTMRSLDPDGNKLLQANAAIDMFKKSGSVKILFPTDNGEIEEFICKRFILYVQRWLNSDFIVPKGGVELGFSHLLFENDDNRFILEGRIDLINTIQGNNCFTDHKTQERTSYLYHYNTQFKTYALATGYEYGIINYFGMQKDDNNKLLHDNKLFRQDLIHFDKWMIDEWKDKVIGIFFKIYNVLKQDANKEVAFYELKNDAACSGAFGANPCVFCNICESPWAFKEQMKQMKYNIGEPWRPW